MTPITPELRAFYDEEVWRDIEGYGGKYQISNLARIKSFHKRYGVKCPITGQYSKIMKPMLNQAGYPYVHLYTPEGKKKVQIIHRLVAIYFIPNPQNFPVVNHIDGDKLNMSITNLEWCTQCENVRHAFRTGLMGSRVGVNNKNGKLTESQVLEIRSKRGIIPQRKLAKIYQVSYGAISKIMSGRNWNHLLIGQEINTKTA